MKVSEETLMQAGFTPRKLGKIKNISQRAGDTLGEAIRDLARRFVIAAVAVTFCLVVFLVLLVFGSAQSVIPGAIGLACGAAVAAFSQPPSSLTKPGVSAALSAAERCFCCREAVRK